MEVIQMSIVPICKIKVRSLSDLAIVPRQRGEDIRNYWGQNPDSDRLVMLGDGIMCRFKDIVWIKDDFEVQQDSFSDYVKRLSDVMDEQEELQRKADGFSDRWKDPDTGKPLSWCYTNENGMKVAIGRWFKKTVYGNDGVKQASNARVLESSGQGSTFVATIALCLVDPENKHGDLEMLDKYTADILSGGKSYNP